MLEILRRGEVRGGSHRNHNSSIRGTGREAIILIIIIIPRENGSRKANNNHSKGLASIVGIIQGMYLFIHLHYLK